jgi:hypothetical protein
MRKINARDFMNRDIVGEMASLPDEKLEIEFDDGVLVTNTRRTVLSWFCWELHRKFPRTPLNINHHIGNDFPNADMIPKTLSNILKDLHYTYFNPQHAQGDHDSCYDREGAWMVAKDIGQEIYNTMSIYLEEWHVSINAFHLLELYDYPPLAEIRASIEPNQLSITKAYDRSSHILMKDPAILHNPIVRGLRSGQIKMGQFLQILVCRGYLTDADQVIFRKPIVTGFFEGMTLLHDIMIESCSAKKALMFTKKPLRIVEYFNRKMQLSSTVVHTLSWDDCGSDRYAEIHVDSSIFPHLEGKFYLNEKNKLTPLELRDKSKLVGKTLLFRSSMFCKHRGEGRVCHVCFGELAWSVPVGTSIGHLSATEMCREGSQRTLSVKHLDGSSVVDEIIIDDENLPYISICAIDPEDSNGFSETDIGADIAANESESSLIKFNPRISEMCPVLILSGDPDKNVDNGSNLASITTSTEIERLNIHRFTSFKEVSLRVTNLRNETTEVTIPVSQGARMGSLSRIMLKHIQQYGYALDDEGNYCINLAEWNFAAPAFSLPRRHASTLDFMAAVEAFIRSPSKKDRKDAERSGFTGKLLTSYRNPVDALLDFSDLVNSQLWVHISHLEVILLSMMRPADDPDDYGLPAWDRPEKFEEHRALMQYRSLGQQMAYERQPDTIEDPDTYLLTNRPQGLLDPFIYPEVI